MKLVVVVLALAALVDAQYATVAADPHPGCATANSCSGNVKFDKKCGDGWCWNPISGSPSAEVRAERKLHQDCAAGKCCPFGSKDLCGEPAKCVGGSESCCFKIDKSGECAFAEGRNRINGWCGDMKTPTDCLGAYRPTASPYQSGTYSPCEWSADDQKCKTSETIEAVCPAVGESTICRYDEVCQEDGTCREKDCSYILEVEKGLVGEITSPPVPDCMKREHCATEIKEMGGVTCIRAKSTETWFYQQDFNYLCTTGGFLNPCLGNRKTVGDTAVITGITSSLDPIAHCDFYNNPPRARYGSMLENSFEMCGDDGEYLSPEGKAAAAKAGCTCVGSPSVCTCTGGGGEPDGALAAAIAVPVVVVFVFVLPLAVFLVLYCKKKKKQAPAGAAAVEIKSGDPAPAAALQGSAIEIEVKNDAEPPPPVATPVAEPAEADAPPPVAGPAKSVSALSRTSSTEMTKSGVQQEFDTYKVAVPRGMTAGKRFNLETDAGPVAVTVPAGTSPGNQLEVKVPKPDVYKVAVPAGMRPGQTFKMDTDAGPTTVKVPPGFGPGQEIEVKAPKCDVYKVPVPAGKRPGQTFKMDTDAGPTTVKVPPGFGPGQEIEVKVPMQPVVTAV